MFIYSKHLIILKKNIQSLDSNKALSHDKISISMIKISDKSICKPLQLIFEGVWLTLPPHIFSTQVKPGACYITGQWGRVQNKIKET